MKNIIINKKVNKIISLSLCLLLLFIVLLVLFTPIINVQRVLSITPFDLIRSWTIDDINFGIYESLILSYYIYKYFYLVFAVLAAGTFFVVLFYFISDSENLSKHINNIMTIIVIFLFVSMLVGLNYINVYKTIYKSVSITTYGAIYFFIGLVLLIIKFTMSIIFNKDAIKDELKDSSRLITVSFVEMFLTLLSLFFPLYIFPGTRYRLRGIDVILGKADILSFLPMTNTYKAILIFFTIIVIISFFINVMFFVIKRKIFIHYNKYNNLIGLIAIITYALMGVNYMVVYVDAKGYNTFFNTSMNTYSYIPLALLVLFWLGSEFAKMSISKMNIEYKVYAKPNEILSENKKDVYKPNISDKDVIKDSIVLDPIPAFSEIDNNIVRYNAEYQQRNEHIFTDLTLPKLVKHVIEYAKYSQDRLSYGAVEVKTFIAGLAASRLSILQGMSGTGKTSLPKIFMESIDGICDLVAIESSWRDKNELLGYYNEFNKKYTPKSFTQFLYKASLNKDVPYFIVLDEVNLSRIEYYFSDFLSLMEAREDMRYIKLFDVQLYPHIDERTDYLGLCEGHTIYIPKNVWFIGTANRDESTFEISDKVYDRAQTINFDKRAPKIIITEQIGYPKKFVPYSMLRKLFDASKTIAFDAEKSDVIRRVEELLRPYKISFGNRILKQIEEFVNAYVACSEVVTSADRDKFVHEAVDCIIFSKVVRKLEFKQVTDIDSLIEEFASLKLTKCEEFLHTLVESLY